MKYLESIILLSILFFAVRTFLVKMKAIRQSVLQGRPENRKDAPSKRLTNMLLVAFGQKKMFQRPIPALLHGFIYVGFLVINIEVLGMLIDGIFQTHRILGVTGFAYEALTISNEILAFLVIFVCLLLLYRRNIAKVKRFSGVEMNAPQQKDANLILYIEIVLMLGLFLMNTADLKFHAIEGIALAGSYPVSSLLIGWLPEDPWTLHLLEKAGWWFHILGILAFLNYLPYSKHFHIMMAFPNTFFYKTEAVGKLNAPEHIQNEIKAILDPSFVVPTPAEGSPPLALGAKDIQDLSWKSLLDGFACTECGRCTSVCPANLTGKLLSPRKIIMNIRDRQEDRIQQKDSEKFLLEGYVSSEELWACTTCNACVQECPVNIDPVAPIIEMRRFLVMEQSAAPASLNAMFANLENNGSPWAFPAADRFNWANSIPYKS
jgi:ferredoxin